MKKAKCLQGKAAIAKTRWEWSVNGTSRFWGFYTVTKPSGIERD
jgi:hypothetical protein